MTETKEKFREKGEGEVRDYRGRGNYRGGRGYQSGYNRDRDRDQKKKNYQAKE